MQSFVVFILVLVFFGCSKKDNFTEKTINLISVEKFNGFDPIYAADLYSGNQIGKVYEGLLEYHYLKRPYELVPNLAESMPVVSADGVTYTFKLRNDVFFHDSPCFPNGKGRKMTASDVVYSIKRVADPKLQSTGWWVIDGKLSGLNEWREKYSQADVVNYSETVEGIKAIDEFTVQFKLKKPFPQFLYALAMPFNFIVPHEAVEHFKQEFINYPVGTGAFILPKFDRSNKIVFVKNPTFREKFYPSEGTEDDLEKGLLTDAGKKLPLVDKIVVNIQTESQPRWLAIQKGDADALEIPKDNFDSAISSKKQLNEEYAKKGMRLETSAQLDVTYIAFNHEDPIFKNSKIRQAMSLAFNHSELNKLFYNDTGEQAQSIIPPGIAGHKEDFRNPYKTFDIAKAKKLMQEAGYPDGKGFPTLTYETQSSTVQRQMAEHFVRTMKVIGINIKVNTNTWPEFINKTNKKQAQIFGMAWGADYPDAENFFQLFYSGNRSPGSNSSNFSNSTVDQLFLQSSVMQDSPERTAIYEKLYEVIALETPMIFGVHRMQFNIIQGWLKNFKYMEFNHTQAQYLNMDLEVKKELRKKF
jgi:oligopeptide transport system substrate-binding protein